MNLILDVNNTPTYEDILMFMSESGQILWKDINSFIQDKYNVSPKIAYSRCTEKPGWNVKYQKCNKSICTLYPEKECFTALVVITLNLVPVIHAMTLEFNEEILKQVSSAKPFNGTLWLMISVDKVEIVNNIKKLLELKLNKQVV
jgi:hypothetical protein